MTDDILRRGARGGRVTLIAQALKIGIQLASVLILSRLLSPEDFGLIAMVAVVLSLGDLVRDFGMPLASLQSKELSEAQASNMFWVNTALGSAVALVIAAATPLLIALYDEPRLAGVVPILALVLALNGVQVQIQVQLARAQRFLALAVTDVAAQAVALAMAIPLALAGTGYWALIAQALAGPALLLASRAATTRWIPSLPRRDAGTLTLVKNGAHIGAAQLLTFAASNIDTVLIGAQWGARALGYYNRAFQLLTTPVNRLLGPLTQVVLPSFAKSSLEHEKAHSALLRLQFLLGFTGIWLFSSAAAAAESLVRLALGDQWGPTAPLFSILAIAGCFNVLSYVSYWVFLIGDHSRQLLLYNLVTKPLVIALIVAASFISVHAVAWAYAIGLAISWPINLVWLRRVAGLPARDFLFAGIRLLASGAVSFALAVWVRTLMQPPGPVLQLLVSVLVSTIGFFAVTVATRWGRRQLRLAWALARTLRE